MREIAVSKPKTRLGSKVDNEEKANRAKKLVKQKLRVVESTTEKSKIRVQEKLAE
jgi:hypothetical protein